MLKEVDFKGIIFMRLSLKGLFLNWLFLKEVILKGVVFMGLFLKGLFKNGLS